MKNAVEEQREKNVHVPSKGSREIIPQWCRKPTNVYVEERLTIQKLLGPYNCMPQQLHYGRRDLQIF